MNKNNHHVRELQTFFVLWITQSLSELGSSMTSFALILWLYGQNGSALSTALLSVCSYAPYVLLSIFAGTISDKWNKKTVMLICDTVAAAGSAVLFIMLQTNRLAAWHLYAVNIVNGIMNTVQQPASDVAITLVTPRKFYQKVSGLKSFSNALVTVFTPMAATALFAFSGLNAVIFFDLFTFLTAFTALLFFIRIPKSDTGKKDKTESVFKSAEEGISYLRKNRGIFDLILFLAAINLTASMYELALPPMILSRNGGSKTALGFVTAATGLSALLGSLIASVVPEPKSRIRIIRLSLLFSMSTENFLLAFGRSVPVWCTGAVLGWFSIPLMNTNLNAIMRLYIPVRMQGRVYAARNAFQFFTIPVGYLLGGFLIDRVFEPFFSGHTFRIFITLFGSGKGTGAACLFAVLGVAGVLTCLVFSKDRYISNLEKDIRPEK
jgi:MFS transporter, DHA3 family, macrolide efflux protein